MFLFSQQYLFAVFIVGYKGLLVWDYVNNVIKIWFKTKK